MRWRRPVGGLEVVPLGTALSLRGRVWVGDGTAYDDGRVVVDDSGRISAIGPATAVPAAPDEVEVAWVGPGLDDAHVHLSFGDPDLMVRHGVVRVRDLGAPPADAARFRRLAAPLVEVAGPLLTAPAGYPSRSWGSGGFAAYVDDVEQVERLVGGLCTQVDVIKLALEAGGGSPVPSPEVAAAVVRVAHGAGLDVTCHALSVAMVERALDAGIDELAHTPTEALPDELVSRIAATGVRVISTLQTFVSGRVGAAALDNATRLAAAGVDLRYGTDLGNAGTRPGAEPRELRLLAERVGLGAEGAARSATTPLLVGAEATLVGLPDDPLDDSEHWRKPVVVVVGRTVLRRGEHP